MCTCTPEYTCCDISISSKYFVTCMRISVYSCLCGFVIPECSVTQQEISWKLLLKGQLIQIKFTLKCQIYYPEASLGEGDGRDVAS